MYTSGTTGPPKGAVLSRAAIAADLDGLAEAWGWTPDDTLVHGLPLFHVHGLILGVLGALAGRLAPRAHRPPDARALRGGRRVALLRACRPSGRGSSRDPASAAALAGARLLVSGSAALPVPVFEQMQALTGHTPVERYGMTETLDHDQHAPRRRAAARVGRACRSEGVETRLRADDGGDGRARRRDDRRAAGARRDAVRRLPRTCRRRPRSR